jgi:hypothetical protein
MFGNIPIIKRGGEGIIIFRDSPVKKKGKLAIIIQYI